MRKGREVRREHSKCCTGCRKTGSLIDCWWECKMKEILLKTVKFLKLDMQLPQDTVIALLAFIPEILKYMLAQKPVHKCL